jgi:hypothetical protein
MLRNGASSSTKEVSVFLCRRYVCCTIISAALSWGPGHYELCHCTNISIDAQSFSVNVHLCSTLFLSVFKHSETAVKSAERSQAWPPPSLSLLYLLCIPRTFLFTWFSGYIISLTNLKSRTCYYRRSVGHSVSVSSPSQVFYYCQLWFCRRGEASLTRGRVYHLPRSRSTAHIVYIYNFICRHSI